MEPLTKPMISQKKTLAMTINHKLFTFLIVCLLISFSSFAQREDLTLRAGTKVYKELSKKWTTTMEVEYRLQNNFSEMDRILFEPGITYKLNKAFRFGAIYRYNIKTHQKFQYEFTNRLKLHADYKIDFSDFELKLRTAFQYDYDDLVNFVGGDNRLINRNLIGLEYDIFGTKLTPSINFEYFHHLNNPDGDIIKSWRSGAGLAYPLNKKLFVEVSYLFDKDTYGINPMNTHIFLTSLKIKL